MPLFQRSMIPITDLDGEARLVRLEQAMRKVKRMDREIFMAHRLDNMSYEAIAERTGLTVDQVENAIARTLIRLDRELYPRPRRKRFWFF